MPPHLLASYPANGARATTLATSGLVSLWADLFLYRGTALETNKPPVAVLTRAYD
jgi:hypothetical protein